MPVVPVSPSSAPSLTVSAPAPRPGRFSRPGCSSAAIICGPCWLPTISKSQQKLVAIYQLLKVCGEQVALGDPSRTPLSRRVRRIEALNEDTHLSRRRFRSRRHGRGPRDDHSWQQGLGVPGRSSSGIGHALHADQPPGRALPAAAVTCPSCDAARAITKPRRSVCSLSRSRGRATICA